MYFKKRIKDTILPLIIFLLLFINSTFSIEIPEKIEVRLQIDNTTARVNERIVQLDAPPKIFNNKTYVPIRFISEAFGAEVEWDSNLRMVTITIDNPEYYLNKSIEQEVEVSRLKDQIKTKDSTIKSLENDIKRKNAEIEFLKEENANLKTDITNLNNQIESLNREIENLKKGNNGADLEYRNIKINVDGKVITTSLEPFVYKGKVFTSLEDICPAIGKTFKWDEKNNVFYIGSYPNENPPTEGENDLNKRFTLNDLAITVNSTSIGGYSNDMWMKIDYTLENIGELSIVIGTMNFALITGTKQYEVYENRSIFIDDLKSKDIFKGSITFTGLKKMDKDYVLRFYDSNARNEYIEIKLDR